MRTALLHQKALVSFRQKTQPDYFGKLSSYYNDLKKYLPLLEAAIGEVKKVSLSFDIQTFKGYDAPAAPKTAKKAKKE